MIRHLLFLFPLILLCGSAWALEPDQIVLVVNQNVPVGLKLAEQYVAARQIPPQRIVSLNLPTSDEVSFDQYERDVVPPIRDFLARGRLEKKVTCLVTFYGVPLRVSAKVHSPQEQDELKQIEAELTEAIRKIEAIVASTENQAKAVDRSFQAAQGSNVDALARRADATWKTLARSFATTRPQADALAAFTAAFRQLGGDAIDVLMSRAAPPKSLLDMRQEAKTLEQRRFDPADRARLRTIIREHFGLFSFARLLRAQGNYLQAADSSAAMDNELALLWWTYYPRTKWEGNPLNHRARDYRGPPVMMVMRLDGPSEQCVREIITTSVQAEQKGLAGRIVLDSRGISTQNKSSKVYAYGRYDQTIRNLAGIIKAKTKLELTHDDRPEILEAGAVSDVALYCGWYRLHHYVPCCRFVPGAVAFHIASSELVTLRGAGDTGWVRGLLSDGAVASLGPVAEPYLHAFPPADEFFPLLLTGKLTLAEVYWKTTPLTSWQITAIGDPLYTPYKNNPALALDDLPAPLRKAMPTTQAHSSQSVQDHFDASR